MNTQRRKEINSFAEQVRIASGLDSPLDLEKIILDLNGELEKSDTLENDVEAMIFKKDATGFKIVIDGTKPLNRQRFSIAHEIGHLFLHMGYLVNKEKWSTIGTYLDSVKYRFGHSEEEQEANEFAAALLMPSEEFKAVAKTHFKDGRYNLQPIADHFSVSMESVRFRGRWLQIFSWE